MLLQVQRTSSRESRFLNFVYEERKRSKIETKRLQQRSKRKQKSEQKWKSRQVARRKEMAEEQLLPIIPYLTTEQGVRALEINQDDIGRTIDWCFSQVRNRVREQWVFSILTVLWHKKLPRMSGDKNG